MAGIVWLFGCGTTKPVSEADLITEAIEKADQTTTFFLTDAPSDDFQSVSVDILSPIQVTMDGAIIDVPLPESLPIRVDLLELDGVSDLLTSAILPAGTISKIVLPLANPEIVLLDDTVLDSSDIDFPTPELVISQDNGIVIKKGEGDSILIDFDVASSFKIDLADTEDVGIQKPRMAASTATSTRRVSLQPQGTATSTSKGNRPEGMKASSIKGEIARIPGIKDKEMSFLIKHSIRKSLIPVEVIATSTIRTFDGLGNFKSLQVGQQVEVNGSFSKGTLQAKAVLILPKDYKGVNGMLTDLTATSFHVLLPPDMATSTEPKKKAPSATDKTRKKIKVIYDSNKTAILLQHTDKKGEASHLANGQRVEVRGQASAGTDVIDARSITISPSPIKGFITHAADCSSNNKQIRLISVPMHKEVEKSAGTVAATSTPKDMLVSWIVEINEAKLMGEKGTAIECSALREGMAVKAFGMIFPDPLVKHTMKAVEVKQISLDYIEGTVDSLLPDGKGLILNVVPTKRNAFGGSSASSTPKEGAQFKLKVVLSEYLKDEGFVLNDTLLKQQIHIAGFFRSMEKNATSSVTGETGSNPNRPNQKLRDHYFIAFVIEDGLAPPPPKTPPPPTTPPTNMKPCSIYPPDNAWNTDISNRPVDPDSDKYIARLALTWSMRFIPNLPINTIDRVKDKVPMVNVNFFDYPNLDQGLMPIPPDAVYHVKQPDKLVLTDNHLTLLETNDCKLYELWNVKGPNPDGTWSVGSGSIHDLTSNALRPDKISASTASGLPALPGIVREDEVRAGVINHAIATVATFTHEGYIRPATNFQPDEVYERKFPLVCETVGYSFKSVCAAVFVQKTLSMSDPFNAPMGLRIRLKKDYDISGATNEAKPILQALKTYGMIIGDGNGTAGNIRGEKVKNPSVWNWSIKNNKQLMAVQATDFEVVAIDEILK